MAVPTRVKMNTSATPICRHAFRYSHSILWRVMLHVTYFLCFQSINAALSSGTVVYSAFKLNYPGNYRGLDINYHHQYRVPTAPAGMGGWQGIRGKHKLIPHAAKHNKVATTRNPSSSSSSTGKYACSAATTSGRFCFLYEVTKVTRPCLEQQPRLSCRGRQCAVRCVLAPCS
jgi:hypothetical protein